MFKERTEAAKQLATELEKYKKEDCIILALPKGGLPIGSTLSKELKKPFEVYLTEKISHPENKNLKVGAVDLTGRIINKDMEQATESFLEHEIGKVRNQLQNKYQEYMGTKAPLAVNNKVVILVDDGVENGEDMVAVVELLKKNKPLKIVLAVPVATESFKNDIKELVDEFICLEVHPDIEGVRMAKNHYEELDMEKYLPLARDEEQTKDQ